MRRLLSLLRHQIVGVAAASSVAAMAALSPAMAADMPAGVASKLYEKGSLSRLWAEPGVRLPVIIQFAMPSLPDRASYASVQDADAAQIAAVHATQDRILGNTAGIDRASAESSLALKRMDYSPMFAANVTAAELEAFAANGEVVRIHEDALAKPTLDQAVPLIGMPAAYAAGATGACATVAVLDTGGRRTHEFLSSKIIGAACFSTTNAGQFSTSYCPGGAQSSTTIDSANDCLDSDFQGCGHGTHVSGIAAGFNTNRQAGEPANGVARDGTLVTINVFSQFSTSQAACGGTPCVLSFQSDQIKGLERVLQLKNAGTNIASANMSLGGGANTNACDGNAVKPIIDQLRAANVATVIAAGNDGLNTQVGAPGCISTAITVASSTKADVRSSFSNWGNLIDVVAPGSSILSSTTNATNGDTFYASFNGTSMASPMVAGTWAALRSARPNDTVDQIEAALKSTGLGITSSGVTKPRIRVDQALTALGGGTPPIIVAAVTPVSRATSVGGQVTAFATVINAGTATATGCNIALPNGTAGVNFTYKTRDFNTDALGPDNTPVDIAGGNTRQDFLMVFNPTAAMSTNIALVFKCANTAAATSVVGLNTFLLTAANPAPADLISIAVTNTNDGIANVPLNGTGFAALAGNNIGAASTLTATVTGAPVGGGAGTLPANLTLCQTNGGACVNPPSASVTFNAASNTIVTFTAFIASNGTAIPFDPANTRMFVHFTQAGTAVGSASVAVRTVAPDQSLASAK